MDIETVEAVPRSPVSVEATARGIRIVQDKPAEAGGQDAGMMASELLLAALLGCQNSTFVKVAAKRRVAVDIHRLVAEAHFSDGTIGHITVRYHVHGHPGVSDEQIQTVVRLTDKACTISKALAVPVHVEVERTLATGA